MVVLQWRRWRASAIVFAYATPVVLWLVWELVGRSLSAFEIFGVIGAILAIVAAFTWALSSEHREVSSRNDVVELNLSVAWDLPESFPRIDNPLPPLTSEEGTFVAQLTSGLAYPAPTASASTLGIARSSSAHAGQSGVAKDGETAAGFMPATHLVSDSTTLKVADQPKVGSEEKARAEFPVELSDRVETACREETAWRWQDLRWCGCAAAVTVGEYPLRDPMVYVSRGNPPEDEPSCIDLNLNVGQPKREVAGSLSLDPRYATLTPDQRANYLCWLAGGRRGGLDDFRYALLFLCGLERRLLLEQRDLSPIVREVVRLLESYPSSGLLEAQLNRFLAFSLARPGTEGIDDQLFEAVYEGSRLDFREDFLAIALMRFYKRHDPLPAVWAIRIARRDPRFRTRTALDHRPKRLFQIRYQEQFGTGLVVGAFSGDREISYDPVNPSLSIDVISSRSSTRSIRIPDVLGIRGQFSPLVALFERCIDDPRWLNPTLVTATQTDIPPEPSTSKAPNLTTPLVASAPQTPSQLPESMASRVQTTGQSQRCRHECTPARAGASLVRKGRGRHCGKFTAPRPDGLHFGGKVACRRAFVHRLEP